MRFYGTIIDPMVASMNSNFAIRIEHYYYQTKDKERATEFYHINKDATEGVRIIKELKNPNQTHKYSAKDCIREIKQRLQRDKITLTCKNLTVEFNKYYFGLFIDYFKLKDDERYCFTYQVTTYPIYSYSIQTIDFIVTEIKKAPDHILDDLKQKVKKNANPGSKGFSA